MNDAGGIEKDEASTRIAPPPRVFTGSLNFGSGQTLQGPDRRWLIITVLVLLGLAVVTGAGLLARSLMRYQKESTVLVGTLHDQMNRKDWDGIYREASSEYQEATTLEKHRVLFQAIDKKLGGPVSTKQGNIAFNSNNGRTDLTAGFDTKFSLNASGTERVVWTKVGFGRYRMLSYNINSMDLIER